MTADRDPATRGMPDPSSPREPIPESLQPEPPTLDPGSIAPGPALPGDLIPEESVPPELASAGPLLDNIDIVVPDVPAATRFLLDAVGLTAGVAEDRSAQFTTGGITVVLTPELPVDPAPNHGTVLHFRVPDVEAALARATAAGATVLRGPGNTDEGTHSVLLAGPADLVVDLYRPV